MAKYFYTDTDGQKQGPLDDKQLEELIKQGTVVANTLIEMDDGYCYRVGGEAGAGYYKKVAIETPKSSESSSYQFDFMAHWRTCQAIKVINMCIVVLVGIAMTCLLFHFFGQLKNFPGGTAEVFAIAILSGIVGTWIFVVFQILAVRMLCEWSLITSKAAQLYVERCEGKQEK